MHIALIDPSLFTLPYDVKLAEALQDRGHRLSFFGKALTSAEHAPREVQLHQHFYRELVILKGERWPAPLARIAKGLCHLRAMRHLLDVFDRDPPDVIHFQWLPLPVIDRTFLSALRRRAPLVITAHDSKPFNANPGSAVQQWGATTILGRFDRVIVHTEQARGRLLEYGVAPHRVARIAHGFLDKAPTGNSARPASDAPVRFLIFGKIKPYKGIDLMIEAIRRLPSQDRARCRLRVVGKPYMDMGPLLAAAAQLPEQVMFDPRFVPDAEMASLFDAADVLAFPYREIEMSGVLMASLRACRPMLASRIGGFAELLEDGRHALLVPPGDVDALSTAIGRLIREGDTRQAMAGEIANLVAEIPGWDAIARSTEAVYAEARAS